MPEQTSFEFSPKEVVTALLKAQGIHTGIWQLSVRFGLKATNFGSTDADLVPTALVPVLAIGIQKADKITNVSVDAAEANPEHAIPRQTGSGKTGRAALKKG